MDTLNDIISGLKWGNLDPTEAHNRVLALFSVSQRSDLLRVFDSFFEWHKEQGYVSIKRDDFEEYLKNLNCG